LNVELIDGAAGARKGDDVLAAEEE
jgi:hypothetical protein